MSTTTTYAVTGMTCEHCVQAVREEIGKLGDVETVEINLTADGASRVEVTAEAPLPLAQVRDVITEAGYTLTEPVR